MLQQPSSKDDQVRQNCAELSTYPKQLTPGRKSCIFWYLDSGWVILKEKSISQIILHGRTMTNKTKTKLFSTNPWKNVSFLGWQNTSSWYLMPKSKSVQIFVKSISQNCHIDHQRLVSGSKIVITFWCDIWNLLSSKIDRGTEKGTNSGRQDWPSTWLFANRGSHFLTLMLEFLPKRERDDPQMWASAAYILVWADRRKVQFSAILNDNWFIFKIESVCQYSEHLNVTFWFIILSLVFDLWPKWYQISEKNLNFWHSY